jgi:DNA-binding CsgD family transcriptional regulator
MSQASFFWRFRILLIGMLVSIWASVAVAQLSPDFDSLRQAVKDAKGPSASARQQLILTTSFVVAGQLDSADNHLGKAKAILASLPNDTNNVRVSYLSGVLAYVRGNFQAALPHFSVVVSDANNGFCLTDRAKSWVKLGLCYQRLNRRAEGIAAVLEAEKLAKQQADPALMGDVYFMLGVLYGATGNHPTVKRYYEQALQYIPAKDEYRKAMVLNSLALLYSVSNQDRKAIDAYLQCYQIALKLNAPENGYGSLANAGLLIVNQPNYLRALPVSDTLLAAGRRLKRPYLMHFGYAIRAQYHKRQNHYKLAQASLDSGITCLKRSGEISSLPQLLAAKTEIDSLAGDYKKSLRTRSELEHVKDLVFDNQNQAKIEEMRIKFDTDKSEERNKILANKLETESWRRNTLVAVVLLLVLAAIGLWFILRQTKRLSNQRAIILEKERLTAMLEQEQAAQQVAFLSKQLSLKEELAQAEQNEKEAAYRALVSTNTLSAHRRDVIAKTQTVLKQYPKLSRQLEDLLERVEDSQDLELEWEKYKAAFLQIHPDFFKRLDELSPSLSANDERLAAYLLMGITGKDLANLLNLTEQTVHNNRSKLRKRLGLQPSEDLVLFLQQLAISEALPQNTS